MKVKLEAFTTEDFVDIAKDVFKEYVRRMKKDPIQTSEYKEYSISASSGNPAHTAMPVGYEFVRTYTTRDILAELKHDIEEMLNIIELYVGEEL